MYSTDDLVQRAVQALRKMRKGIYNGVNPRAGVTIPKEKKHGRKRRAYTLEEVEKHLELFPGTEPTIIQTESGPYTPEITQGVVPGGHWRGGICWLA
jgi:hypothetical protein